MCTYLLKRTDKFTSEISDYFRECRRVGLFTDVRLYGSDPTRPIEAHGLVLHTVSPFFQELQLTESQEEDKLTDTELIFPEATVEDIQHVIDGIYNAGRSAISESDGISDLIEILQLGAFGVKHVKKELAAKEDDYDDVPMITDFIKQELVEFDDYNENDDSHDEDVPPALPRSSSSGGSPKVKTKRPQNELPELPEVIYTCRKCNFGLKGEKTFRQHMKDRHDDLLVYCCRHCPEVFTNFGDRMQHEKASHPELKNPCPGCGKSLKTKTSLKKHMRRFHKDIMDEVAQIEKPFSCNLCDQRFGSKSGRKSHLRIKHSDRPRIKPGKPYVKRAVCLACSVRHEDGVCCVCKKQLGDFKKAHLHVKDLHLCGIDKECQLIFLNKAEKEEHLNKAHGQSLYHPCPYCGQKVERASLDTHMRIQHETGNSVTCELCGEVFKYSQYLKRHKIFEHGTPEEKATFLKKQQAFCGLCGKTFYDDKALRKHTNHIHLKIKAFKCTICSRDFVTKQSLQNHVRSVHEGIREKKRLK